MAFISPINFIPTYFQTLNSKQKATIFFCFIVGLVNAMGCWRVTVNPDDEYISLSICSLGGILGWLLGIAITPYDDEEHSRFTAIGKTLSAFITGYLISKFDGVIVAIAQRLVTLVKETATNKVQMSDLVAIRTMGFVSFFLVGLICVYVFRSYVSVNEESNAS